MHINFVIARKRSDRSNLRDRRLLRRSLRSLLAMTVCLVFLSVTVSFAEVYISAEEAIRQIFPSLEKYEEQTRIVDGQEVKIFTMRKQGDVIGWAVALDEMGKVKPITFLVGIDNQHKVLAVYILEYRDLFGADIKRKSFLKQFRDKTIGDTLIVGKDIDTVTGATISSKAATAAVKNALKIVRERRM